jgi:hypothetical protein
MKTKFALLLIIALAFSLALATSAHARDFCGTSLDLAFDDTTGKAITSDGGGPYLAAAALDCSGKMTTLFADRAIHMELTPTDSSAGYPTIVGTVFGNLGIWGFPYGDDDVTPVPAQRIQFNFLYGGENCRKSSLPNCDRYWLQLGTVYSGTSTGTLTKVNSTTWTVEASATEIARLVRCPAKGKCDLINNPEVLGYYFVPFKITLTAAP